MRSATVVSIGALAATLSCRPATPRTWPCPPRPSTALPAWRLVPDSTPPATAGHEMRGLVWFPIRFGDAGAEGPVAGALVGLRDGAGRILGSSQTSADGRFVLPLPPAESRVELRTTRIGYRTRIDTLSVPLPSGQQLYLPMQVAEEDGSCIIVEERRR